MYATVKLPVKHKLSWSTFVWLNLQIEHKFWEGTDLLYHRPDQHCANFLSLMHKEDPLPKEALKEYNHFIFCTCFIFPTFPAISTSQVHNLHKLKKYIT